MRMQTVIVLALFAILAGTLQADEMSDLQTKVKSQDREIAQLKDQYNQLEARQRIKEKAMKQEIAAAKQQSGPSKLPSWLEKISLFGDFRYRHEQISDNGSSSDDKKFNRNRIRARVGMKAKVNDEFDINLRIASGSDDPRSTNQTLDGGWSSKSLYLDRAYLAYHPEAVSGLDVGLGKAGVPFHKQNGNQMIWDDDLNLEGIFATYGGNICADTAITGALGGFWVEERHGSAELDTGMFGGQVLVDQAINGSNLTGGAGYYYYTAVEGQSTLYGSKFYGNSNSSSMYDMNYGILEVFLGWASQIDDLPYSVFGSWVLNTEATANSMTGDEEDTGYIAGATVGKTKNQWDWAVAYDYRHVKADAVLSQFQDSDFLGGYTGGKGHRVSGALQVHKNATFVATWFLDNQYDGSHSSGKAGKNYNRLQFDLKVKVK